MVDEMWRNPDGEGQDGRCDAGGSRAGVAPGGMQGCRQQDEAEHSGAWQGDRRRGGLAGRGALDRGVMGPRAAGRDQHQEAGREQGESAASGPGGALSTVSFAAALRGNATRASAHGRYPELVKVELQKRDYRNRLSVERQCAQLS
jgi:hypothetical protein